MTAAEQTAFKYKWDRFQRRYERIYTTKFKAALREQINQWKQHGAITSAPIYKVLVDLYKTVGSLWAHATQVGIKKQQVKSRQPMGFNERIVELMKQYYGIDLLNDAEDITAYTREVIERVLGDAALSGASINDIVRALESNSELSTMRATRIARTEVISASNSAAVINAKELDIPMRKIWLAIHDRRTRKSHIHVDGNKVELDGYFVLDKGVTMQQPGARTQSSGLPVPADEIVNCRCTCAFEVIEN